MTLLDTLLNCDRFIQINGENLTIGPGAYMNGTFIFESKAVLVN